MLSVSVLNGFQGILQTEAKKIYGDYLVEDISNTSFLRDLNMDNENYSIFQKNEFLIVSNNKQNIYHLQLFNRSFCIMWRHSFCFISNFITK